MSPPTSNLEVLWRAASFWFALFLAFAGFVSGAKPQTTSDGWDIARGLSHVYFNPLFWVCVIGCLVALRRARKDTERPAPQEPAQPLGPPAPPANLPAGDANYGEREALSGDIGEDAESDILLKSPERLLLERGGLVVLVVVAVLFATRLVRTISDVADARQSRSRELLEGFTGEQTPERIYGWMKSKLETETIRNGGPNFSLETTEQHRSNKD